MQTLFANLSGSIHQHYHYPRSTEWRGEVVESLKLNADNLPASVRTRLKAVYRDRTDSIIRTWVQGQNTQSKLSKGSKSKVKYPLECNSLHHQGMFPANIVNTPILPLATSVNDGNIEIALVKGMPIAMCQFHPKSFGA